MKLLLCSVLLTLLRCSANAQEAASGVDLRATVTAQTFASNGLTEAPQSGSPVAGGYRSVLYPTLKLNDHLVIMAALQSISRPYLYQSLSSAKYGISDNILQTNLAYARSSDKGSFMLRAGILSTAFGSFLLHYDDADNPLADAPIQYGYYSSPVTTLGLLGAQADVTRGKWDGRVQLANSSPANPQSVSSRDQSINWVAGGGYTVRQGLRIGVSAYRGPFVSRNSAYFGAGEASPMSLSARAAGVDVQWAKGHWNMQGEWQTFVFPYEARPTLREQAGYLEAKRVLTPRWYIAARSGYTHSSPSSTVENFEVTGGLRTNRFQIIKFSYELSCEQEDQTEYYHTATIQLVTSIHAFSHASR